MFNISFKIMENTVLTSSEKLVYIFIANIGGQISYQTIAAGTGVTSLTAMRSVKRLLELNFISLVKDSQGRNVYEVIQ